MRFDVGDAEAWTHRLDRVGLAGCPRWRPGNSHGPGSSALTRPSPVRDAMS